MKQWSLTLHGPNRILSQFDSGEAHFVVGSEQGGDVITVSGEGVAARHARVSLNRTGVQVEDLGSGIGTLVNGYLITKRVVVSYPASVQIGELTLVVEENPIAEEIAVSEEAAAPASDVVKVTIPARVRPSGTGAGPGMEPLMTPPAQSKNALPDIAITIPQRKPPASKPNLDVTVPQKAPNRSARQQVAEKFVAKQEARKPDAPLTGGYTLVREIARGGMGQIYFGEDPQLKREVAVKVSSISEGGEDPRFTKEAEVLAQLAHPNVVPIHSIGVDKQGRPFYAMKLVKGRTLQAVLNAIRDGDAAAVKDYSLATLITIFRKVCDAMAFAHSKRILHRDLKPENIMVGEYGEVLVMDWGLAKVLEGVLGEQGAEAGGGSGGETRSVASTARVNESGDFGMTMEGEVMGTPQYMSPEQAEGMVAELDERSDIYSLGGVLYAILTLRPPIDGKTLNEVLSKVKNGQISSMITKRGGKGAIEVGTPAAIGAEVPEALRAVTLKAMAKERAKRYASVEEFAADLEAYQNGFATRAEDAGTLRKLVLFVKRHKAVSALATAMLLGAVLFTVRLAASEKVALANAERAAASAEEARRNEQKAQASEEEAKRNEQKAQESEQQAKASERKAIEEKEAARRTAAQVQIALAEAAEAAADPEQMRTVLSQVPEDLRDATWRYLDRRVDTPDIAIAPPGQTTWEGLEDDPNNPEGMLALQSDGTVNSVNTSTGELKPLWKATFPDRARIFGVSRDGQLAAVGFSKSSNGKETFSLEVRRVSNGNLEGELKGSQIRGVNKIWLSSGIVLMSAFSPTDGHKLVAYDFILNKMLWERSSPASRIDRFSAGFSVDEKTVFCLNVDGEVQSLDPRSGEIRRAGLKKIRRFGANFPEAINATPNWDDLYMTQVYQPNRLRRFNPWTGELMFESTLLQGVSAAVGLLQKQNLVVTLCRRSDQGCVLEFKHAKSGDPDRLLPFLGKVWRPGGKVPIRTKDDRIAVLLSDRLMVWNVGFGNPTESYSSYIGYGCWHVIGNTRNVLLTKIKDEKPKLFLNRLAKSDVLMSAITELELSGFPDNRVPFISVTPDGSKTILSVDGNFCVYSIADGHLEKLWSRRLSSDWGARPFSVHPQQDLLWCGDKVVELSSGKALVEVNRRGISGSEEDYSKVAWVGADRVVEVVTMAKAREAGGEVAEVRALVLWNAQTGQPVTNVPALRARAVCVSPDGQHIVEAGEDKRVRIRNSKTLALEQDVRVHDSEVNGVAWHPTLSMIATTSNDATLRIWDSSDFHMVQEVRLRGPGENLCISPNGRSVSLRANGNIVIFEPEAFQH